MLSSEKRLQSLKNAFPRVQDTVRPLDIFDDRIDIGVVMGCGPQAVEQAVKRHDDVI